ncbi:cyclically-permuted mutarotase family protein [Colwellia sp. 75C3]|uniref:cyclically-permuted mutarotase family protein n=1 Tax=Colwellia sp. 75C3 TaxID=888425 RepID=UPI0012FEB6A2|nr:cyclically-permuted mutarotase family protein [Colwellia sp. 75C3]
MNFFKLCTISTLFFCFFSHAFDQGSDINVITSKANKIYWQKFGELPVPEQFTESLGVSAAYSGFIGDYLIVAGGANFPKGHPFFDQGNKQFYSDIFVFDTANKQLNLVARGHLPIKAGHGATLIVDNSLYLIGGKNNEQAFDTIIKLTLDGSKKPITEVIGNLPFTWDSGGAAWQNNALYTFAGKQNGQVSNQVCKYSFRSETCVDSNTTPPVPGLSRSDFPAINHNDHFYVFGGLNLAAGKDNYVLTDVYAFDFNKARWKTLAPITVDEKAFSVAGGGVAALPNNQLVLLGGVNRDVFNNAILQLTSLKGEALQAFKHSYFSLSKKDINFSRRQVIYDISENSWHALTDEVPFSGGAGPLTVTQKGDSIYWVSGEIKPVIRSPNIYLGSYSRD